MIYTIELTVKKDKSEFGFTSYDKVEAESLLNALSQFQLVLARYAELEKQYIERHSTSYICSKCGEDDIPF
jgi:hypothetical protein